MSVVIDQNAPTMTRVQLELTPEIVTQIKAELAQQGLPQKVYKFEFDGDTFVFRPLYRKDWNAIQSWLRDNPNVPQDSIDEKVCRTAVIFPDTIFHFAQWDIQRAGYAGSLAKMVLGKSGFFDPELLDENVLRVTAIDEIEAGPRPDEATKSALREQFKNWPKGLKEVTIGTETFVVRPLTRGEWKGIQSGPEPDLDLATAERATIWSASYPDKPKFEEHLAGTVRALSEVIMEISGFLVRGTVEEL